MSEERLDRLYGPKSVAAYLGISVPTVYRLIRAKRLKAAKVGGQWRITKSALREYLESRILV